ncbi:zinc transporter, putative [Entamoeba dispar SAW760]|uniref:Zinc transporter, putative n=1 Tax=Entamoeba dispar (strain ATCC PRA-260 / SAW760) TaxID=370354 RepID=B0EHP9_ENTDS|nr:zinc transporter, putative [Entamoeba dispar SAW760]EDR25945.1 zinc transporter, putative [Entamoeba dispar SAW760]|eukprot:EDR25945.1 zinc transporter, putative [Entamoeba dispar SAW760]
MDWALFGYVVATFFISIIGGLIPFLIKLVKNKTIAIRVINIASVAASGLFLGGGIYHMLAEGLEMMEESGYSFGGYPLGWTLFGVTFFLIFFVDRVIVPHSHGSFEDSDSEEDNYTLLHNDEHHSHHQHTAADTFQEWTTIVVLVVALSIHSFLEGLGLGSANKYLMIFVAIAAHKWADSGLTIIYLMKKIKQWWVLLIILIIFSSFTPLGAIIGKFVIASLDDESVSLLVQGIFCCVAAGSFFFVAIVEILSEAFEEHNNKYVLDKYLKFGLAFILFILMSLTVLLEGEEGESSVSE